ncbi:uncharacterized protein Dwil_GK20109 [Drosophila willistoni]|uniref:CH-like domain-containing protein n=2 Tax=Drosophila willistoni TaxID=7260 RepID=B4MT80_DROWI|nr:uncharacterized protein Dwil_GK20109 [Drosophila willistoni]
MSTLRAKTCEKSSLSTIEEYELSQWLMQNDVNPAKLRRTFTDVLPLARLLSRYFPGLVDVNFYPARNSVRSKLDNWEQFNKRVLSKLGVHMTRDEMDRVARSVPGSIELLLFSIMNASSSRKSRINF